VLQNLHVHLTLLNVLRYAAYWNGFWNVVYVLMPPRENFNSPAYNKFLNVISYYGGLNIRSVIMRVYGAVPAPPSTPPSSSPPIVVTPDPKSNGGVKP